MSGTMYKRVEKNIYAYYLSDGSLSGYNVKLYEHKNMINLGNFKTLKEARKARDDNRSVRDQPRRLTQESRDFILKNYELYTPLELAHKCNVTVGTIRTFLHDNQLSAKRAENPRSHKKFYSPFESNKDFIHPDDAKWRNHTAAMLSWGCNCQR